MIQRLHVVCGGGTGTRIMRLLGPHEVKLSAGILAEDDSDTATCRELGGEVVVGPSRGGVMPSSVLEDARRALRSSEAIVLTPVAFGPGNVVNLRLLEEVVRDRPLWVLRGSDISHRDYTGGEATERFRRLELLSRGSAPNSPRLVQAILGGPPDPGRS